MKYFVRTNRSSVAEGPFDLERARARLRTALRTEHGRGHAVHESQRGIWVVARGAGGATDLVWISDEKDGVVRLDETPEPASFLH